MKFVAKSDQIQAVTVRELTRNVAEIFDQVESGEPVLVIRRGRPIATIQPLEQFVVRRALHERRKTEAVSEEVADPLPPVPDLTDVQWTVLEAVATREHPDDTVRRVGSVDKSGAAMGWLGVYGFIEWKRAGIGYEPTLKGLQALDARSQRDEGGAVS